MIGGTVFAPELWFSKPEGRTSYRGPVILGCSGSAASLRMIEAAPRIANVAGGVVLVCAVRRPASSTPDRHLFGPEFLTGETHLLAQSADVHEAMQSGRDAARRAGLPLVAVLDEPGDPVRSLLRAADRYQAEAVMVGMRRDRPSRQVNRLARRRPARLDLIASNGSEHLLARKPNGARLRRRTSMLPLVPRPFEA
ncbi:universal stress protein [Rhodococcus sp. NPDC003318]|uniref:universal stress protein n=1 Tax=Rhodococcus sp. NPDC003318 TaxID=3364503 RepID=UPI003680ABD5